MKILTGTVISNLDETETGRLQVRPEATDYTVEVIYCTPYSGGPHSGFFAIPEMNSKVLITQPDNSKDWFFLSCIIDYPDVHSTEVLTEYDSLLPDRKMFTGGLIPQRYGLKSPMGNGIVLSDKRSKGNQNIGVKVFGSSGKGLYIQEDPLTDCVILRNEHGDRIKIQSSGKNSGFSGPRGISIECKGSVNITAMEGDVNLEVIDGREINITNKSTGSKSFDGVDTAPGNINIHSLHNDINIQATADTGRVFIDANGPDSLVQIRSGGKVSLHSVDDLELRSEQGDINLKAFGTINIQGADVQLNPNNEIDPQKVNNNYEDMNEQYG